MSSKSNAITQPTEDNYFTIEPVITITIILAINFLFFNLIVGCFPTMTNIYIKIGICFLLSFSSVILTIWFGIYWLMLGGKNYYGVILQIFLLTFVPITAVLFLLIAAPTEAISIFENTIGYLYCINRYKTKLNEIFEVDVGIPEAYKNNYREDKSVLLSLYNYENLFNSPPPSLPFYNPFIDPSKKNRTGGGDTYNFNIKNESYKNKDGIEINPLKELENIVSVKNTIGIFSWFFIE